jgi:hypothetical protein
MYFEMKPDERENAIQYLLEKISDETWEEVRIAIQESDGAWYIDQHFGFGLYVRNLLWKSGLELNGFFMDTIWHELIEEIIKRKYG